MTALPKSGRGRVPRAALWLLVLALLALSGYAIYRSRTTASAAETPQQQTAVVTRGELRVSVSGPGTLQASNSRAVSAPEGGTVLSLPAVGQTAAKGELIARLDPASARQDVESAQLALQKAQVQLETLKATQLADRAASNQSTQNSATAAGSARLSLQSAQAALAAQEQLYAVGGVARSSVDDARAAVQKAQADLSTTQVSAGAALSQQGSKGASSAQDQRSAQLSVDQARLTLTQARQTLADTKIYAPMSGVVSDVTGSVGGAATPAQSLFTLIDTASVDLPVQIDETEIAQVKVGQSAEVTLDAIDGQTFRGRVISVSPGATVQNNIAVFDATVRLLNPDGVLRPGMSAEADIISQDVPDALLIPKKAVETVRSRSYVQFPVAGGDPERRRVRLGADDGTSVVVTSGLKAGDTVLLPLGTRAGSASSSASGQAGTGQTGTGQNRPAASPAGGN